MTVSPYEAQLITASIIAIPGVLMVLVAIFTGQFSRKNEVTKFAVFFEEQEDDFWEQDERYRTPEGGVRRKGGDT